MSEVKIELSNITQDYVKADRSGVDRIVDDVSLTFDGAGINMLLGPSGCGKSTVLKMMGGVRPLGVKTPTSGSILIDGVECFEEHPDVVMVFQKYTNRPDLNVYENVYRPFRFGLWKRRVASEAERKARVLHALDSVGLADKALQRVSRLSGGQNQRVALARALVLRPRVLLMDEPFGALDAQTRGEMQKLLVQQWEEHKCCVVFVTHDITEALVLGDRITVLSTRPAKVALDMKVTTTRPRSEEWLRSREAVGMSNQIIEVLRDSHGGGQVRVSV